MSDSDLRIIAPTAPGHQAKYLYEDREDRARIECECGWFEDCWGFDAGAIADCAYGDHLQEAVGCSRCHGEGEIPVNPGYPDPQTETTATCPNCSGTGADHPEAS